jgi:hypothetical protein
MYLLNEITMTNKQFLKILFFIEFIALVVYGCMCVFLFILGKSMPPQVLPIFLLIILFACILTYFIIYIADWWFD